VSTEGNVHGGNGSVAKCLKQVLDVAPFFQTSPNPIMETRDEATQRVTDYITRLLHDFFLDSSTLHVKSGGRQANYSPVPWVRIYDSDYAPSAQAGFYIVLLFAADGSGVYLSLNQGTSEWRGNKWRPVTDRTVLETQASQARLVLEQWDSSVLKLGVQNLDLRVDQMDVGVESKQRVHNYEYANVAAYYYSVDQLPSDEDFANDLADLLTLLFELYGKPLMEVALSTEKNALREAQTQFIGSRQGRRIDAAANRAIEKYAEQRAMQHFESLGWKVTKLGRPYDLKCVNGDMELHVEVKGTVTKGLEVTLTPGEVRHAKNYPLMALFITSQILLSKTNEASGGVDYIENPWIIQEDRLQASQYSYRIAMP
jgi:MrcB-like, N-terminal domain/Domain of unknown function (DUF3883)